MIRLKYACLAWVPNGCMTLFEDGSEIGACPHDTHHYHVIAHRLGYGDDILSYCREHELAHHMVEEAFYDRPSRVLWELAHGRVLSAREAVYEEGIAQMFQRWLRAGERPIIGGVPWDALKAEAVALLGQVEV